MISVSEYIKHVYKWDVSQIRLIKTKYATNANYLFAYMDNCYFMKLYVSKEAFENEKWFLKNLTSTDNIPELIDFYEGDNKYSPSIVLKYYTSYKTLDTNTISKDIAFDIGTNLYKLHNGIKDIDYWGKIYEVNHPKSWEEYLESRIKKIMQSLEKHNIAVIKQVYREVVGNLDNIPHNIVPKCVHGDLNPDNILYDSATKSVLFIDYERSYIGHAQMDFSKLFWRCFKFDKQLIQAFCRGYGINLNSKLVNLYLNVFLLDILNYLVNCIFQPNSITVPKGLHAIPLQTARGAVNV